MFPLITNNYDVNDQTWIQLNANLFRVSLLPEGKKCLRTCLFLSQHSFQIERWIKMSIQLMAKNKKTFVKGLHEQNCFQKARGNTARLEDSNSWVNTKTFSGKFPCGLSFESSRVPQIAGKHEQKDTQSN